MAQVVLTSAGIAAIIGASTGGPLINITHFKVGGSLSAPLSTDNGDLNAAIGTATLGGASVSFPLWNPNTSTFQSRDGFIPLTTYRQISWNSCGWKGRLDTSYGSYNIGSMGIYQNNGGLLTLFGYYVFPQLQPKNNTASNNPNSFEIEFQAVYNALSAVVNFTGITPTNTIYAELAGVDLLPSPSTAPTDTYLIRAATGSPLIGVDGNSQAVTAIRRDDNLWSFSPSYRVPVLYTGAAISSASPTGFTDTAINSSLADRQDGYYIIQFLGGPLTGQVRHITSASGNAISWATSTAAAPTANTPYAIYRYQPSGTLVPTGGSTGQVLTQQSSGIPAWQNLPPFLYTNNPTFTGTLSGPNAHFTGTLVTDGNSTFNNAVAFNGTAAFSNTVTVPTATSGTNPVTLNQSIALVGPSPVSKALNTPYTNSSGRPLIVAVVISSHNGASLVASVAGQQVVGTSVAPLYSATAFFIVPVGATYQVAYPTGDATLTSWVEY